MRHFGTLYLYELKKIGKRKMVWVTMTVIVAIAAFVGCGDIFSSRSIITEQETVTMSGLEYQKDKKESKLKLSGKPIDDALLAETREAYQNIDEISYSVEDFGEGNTAAHSSVAGSFDRDTAKMKELARKRKEYRAIYAYVNLLKGYFETIHTIDEKTLYQNRYEKINRNWDELGMTQGEREYWEEKESRIDIPFVYEYADGWSELIGAIYTLSFVSGLAIAVCLANVFSEEHFRKTDQLILCSKYGKKLCYFAKLAAGVTFGVVCGGINLVTTVITVLAIYGTEGSHAIIQILFPLCSRNMTVGQTVLMMVIVYGVTSLLWSIFTMFLSEAMKNGVAVMGMMSGGLFISMILNIPDSFRILSQICELLPV